MKVLERHNMWSLVQFKYSCWPGFTGNKLSCSSSLGGDRDVNNCITKKSSRKMFGTRFSRRDKKNKKLITTFFYYRCAKLTLMFGLNFSVTSRLRQRWHLVAVYQKCRYSKAQPEDPALGRRSLCMVQDKLSAGQVWLWTRSLDLTWLVCRGPERRTEERPPAGHA